MPTATASSQLDDNSPNDEILILKAQLEEMRFYEQKLLETVYWSLGTVATLIFFCRFTNFRTYEKDKQSLERELSLKIERSKSELMALYSKQEIDFSASLEKKISDLSTSLEKDVSDQLQDKLGSINSQLSGLNIEKSLLYADIWGLKEIYSNALTYYVSVLSEAIKENKTSHYSSTLNRILETVDKIKSVTTYDIADLEKVFNLLHPEHQPSCQNIREKVKEKLK